MVAAVAVFCIVTIVFGRRRGAAAIIGLLVSIAVLIWFIIPRIAAGGSPLFIALSGATVIAVISHIVSHGVRRRTFISLSGTLATVWLSAPLALVAVSAVRLSGVGSDEAFYLSVGVFGAIDLRGLLLGGIVLGALGILDDVTSTQAATVDEISQADPTLGVRELYRRGLSVGREHIAALVNTLALAYVGASLPLFLLLAEGGGMPTWLVANGELIVEEVIRTLVGSTALILAVPLTTILAAWIFGRKKKAPIPVDS